ncbi:glycosyltransferase family 2 protein [Rhodocaloribacter sp.]
MSARDLAVQVTAVVINYQTPDLLETAVCSFIDAYPDVPLVIIDNGSADDSRARIEALRCEAPGPVEAWFLEENVYHGPAMHRAMERVRTPYVYFFDSDTETKRAGFLEPMREVLAAKDHHYATGHVVTVNRRGFADPKGKIPVPASAYMMLKRAVYHRLPPFIHHGLPVLENCAAAVQQGYAILEFPIEDYVTHFGRGTAERYGYGLGLRSRLDYLLNKLGL